jgi:hypothetical protein
VPAAGAAHAIDAGISVGNAGGVMFDTAGNLLVEAFDSRDIA